MEALNHATRAVVADPPGEPTTVTLLGESGALAILALGPAECIALASDLLNAARRRLGRPLAAGVSPQETPLAISALSHRDGSPRR